MQLALLLLNIVIIGRDESLVASLKGNVLEAPPSGWDSNYSGSLLLQATVKVESAVNILYRFWYFAFMQCRECSGD